MSAEGMTLRWLQANLPWTIPYSDMFVASAYSMDRVAHDVMHVMKSLGRIAAECEGHDHGRDRKLYGEAFAKEVADLVICALHIAKLEHFDLQDAVIGNSSLRNKVDIQALAALAHEQAGEEVMVPLFVLDRIMRDCEYGSRIWRECDALLRKYRLATPPAPSAVATVVPLEPTREKLEELCDAMFSEEWRDYSYPEACLKEAREIYDLVIGRKS